MIKPFTPNIQPPPPRTKAGAELRVAVQRARQGHTLLETDLEQLERQILAREKVKP